MRILCIKHVEFEGPAIIAEWAAANGHSISLTHIFRDETLPTAESFDILLVMGGPMNIYEEAEHPWLKVEKIFIRNAIDAGKSVLGICLGAQLIADVLGGKVYRNRHKEIGVLDIEMTDSGRKAMPFLPAQYKVFQWHGDSFHIPPWAVHLAKSEACENQAFIYDRRVIGLQFHLESTKESVNSLISHCEAEIQEGAYISGKETLQSIDHGFFRSSNELMFKIMDKLARNGCS